MFAWLGIIQYVSEDIHIYDASRTPINICIACVSSVCKVTYFMSTMSCSSSCSVASMNDVSAHFSYKWKSVTCGLNMYSLSH